MSGFDPIRREIARMTMEMLLRDGRIHSPYRSWLRKTVKRLIIRSVNTVRQQPMAPSNLMKIMGRCSSVLHMDKTSCAIRLKLQKLASMTCPLRRGFFDIRAIDREVEESATLKRYGIGP